MNVIYSTLTGVITLRGQVALKAGQIARWASQVTKRGSGAMIGGVVAQACDRTILSQLGRYRRIVLVSGTNGKSTTTRMIVQALTQYGPIATNAEGANMDAGIISALACCQESSLAVLEVDEMHLSHIADALDPDVIVLLNLSRDQLDRVGEINVVEQSLRHTLARHPHTTVVANCDDVLISSAAYDHPHVVWVAAGARWKSDAMVCPRSGQTVIHTHDHWSSTGIDFSRPDPHWWTDEHYLYGPGECVIPLELSLPGWANRGNAAQALATASIFGCDLHQAIQAISRIHEVSGRYSIFTRGDHHIRLLLAKNPASWQEALSVVRSDVPIVLVVNGQVADSQDLSWLWDVSFTDLDHSYVIASGERGSDLAVRLRYDQVPYHLIHDPLAGIDACPKGEVEVIANYTALLGLQRKLVSAHD